MLRSTRCPRPRCAIKATRLPSHFCGMCCCASLTCRFLPFWAGRRLTHVVWPVQSDNLVSAHPSSPYDTLHCGLSQFAFAFIGSGVYVTWWLYMSTLVQLLTCCVTADLLLVRRVEGNYLNANMPHLAFFDLAGPCHGCVSVEYSRMRICCFARAWNWIIKLSCGRARRTTRA